MKTIIEKGKMLFLLLAISLGVLASGCASVPEGAQVFGTHEAISFNKKSPGDEKPVVKKAVIKKKEKLPKKEKQQPIREPEKNHEVEKSQEPAAVAENRPESSDDIAYVVSITDDERKALKDYKKSLCEARPRVSPVDPDKKYVKIGSAPFEEDYLPQEGERLAVLAKDTSITMNFREDGKEAWTNKWVPEGTVVIISKAPTTVKGIEGNIYSIIRVCLCGNEVLNGYVKIVPRSDSALNEKPKPEEEVTGK